MGFQDKHFFWYKFKWVTTAADGEGGDAIEVANFKIARRGGGPEKAGRSRTGSGDDDEGAPKERARRAEPSTRTSERDTRMHVPEQIEVERREVLGEGRCCFDAFAGVMNFVIKDEDDLAIAH